MTDKTSGIELVVDSGAFSAWTQGKAIDVDEYVKFCLANKEYISHAVNLDVINPNDPDAAAAAGWKNFERMRDSGVITVPVFHAREKISWLEKMVDTVPYVGLSGTSLVSPLEARSFNDLCFHYLTDSKGRPLVRTHSFGDTSPNTLYNFPFYSADSATWMIQAGRAARVKLQGKSYQLRSTKMRDSSYISNDDIGPKKEEWEKECRSLGLNPERVMNAKTTASEMAMIRSYLVASDLLRLQQSTAHVTTFKKRKSLLTKKHSSTAIGHERQGPCKVILVLSPSAYYFNFPLVYLLNIKHVLVSYYYVITAPTKFWHERLLAFLADPKCFCETNPKVRKYYDKMRECLLRTNAIETPIAGDLPADNSIVDTQICP